MNVYIKNVHINLKVQAAFNWDASPLHEHEFIINQIAYTAATLQRKHMVIGLRSPRNRRQTNRCNGSTTLPSCSRRRLLLLLPQPLVAVEQAAELRCRHVPVNHVALQLPPTPGALHKSVVFDDYVQGAVPIIANGLTISLEVIHFISICHYGKAPLCPALVITQRPQHR